jgi:hypothetical protein
MLKVTGILLNVIGLAITAVGIFAEARARRAPLLTPRQAAVLHQVRRKLGWPQQTIHATMAGTMGSVELWANAIVQTPRDPADPIADQLEAIEKNFDAKLDGLKSQLKRDLEVQGRRITSLGDEHGALAGRVNQADQDDRAITSRSMRWELFGITLALFGTTLSAFD